MFLFYVRRARFVLCLRRVQITAGTLLSFQIDHEGIFLFVTPFELALLWPWTQL